MSKKTASIETYTKTIETYFPTGISSKLKSILEEYAESKKKIALVEKLDMPPPGWWDSFKGIFMSTPITDNNGQKMYHHLDTLTKELDSLIKEEKNAKYTKLRVKRIAKIINDKTEEIEKLKILNSTSINKKDEVLARQLEEAQKKIKIIEINKTTIEEKLETVTKDLEHAKTQAEDVEKGLDTEIVNLQTQLETCKKGNQNVSEVENLKFELAALKKKTLEQPNINYQKRKDFIYFFFDDILQKKLSFDYVNSEIERVRTIKEIKDVKIPEVKNITDKKLSDTEMYEWLDIIKYLIYTLEFNDFKKMLVGLVGLVGFDLYPEITPLIVISSPTTQQTNPIHTYNTPKQVSYKNTIEAYNKAYEIIERLKLLQ